MSRLYWPSPFLVSPLASHIHNARMGPASSSSFSSPPRDLKCPRDDSQMEDAAGQGQDLTHQEMDVNQLFVPGKMWGENGMHRAQEDVASPKSSLHGDEEEVEETERDKGVSGGKSKPEPKEKTPDGNTQLENNDKERPGLPCVSTTYNLDGSCSEFPSTSISIIATHHLSITGHLHTVSGAMSSIPNYPCSRSGNTAVVTTYGAFVTTKPAPTRYGYAHCGMESTCPGVLQRKLSLAQAYLELQSGVSSNGPAIRACGSPVDPRTRPGPVSRGNVALDRKGLASKKCRNPVDESKTKTKDGESQKRKGITTRYTEGGAVQFVPEASKTTTATAWTEVHCQLSRDEFAAIGALYRALASSMLPRNSNETESSSQNLRNAGPLYFLGRAPQLVTAETPNLGDAPAAVPSV
ncbi:hypothetical protein BDZ91DRAFT_169738 [Kalaharituber pfeilii]|nr:hypothetical protein BDZ91DRAFT_169738 [Kalaharituber pfeilii]